MTDADVLSAVAEARATLESIDKCGVDDATNARLVTALEQLDNIILDATSEEIVDLADEYGDADTEERDEATATVEFSVRDLRVLLAGLSFAKQHCESGKAEKDFRDLDRRLDDVLEGVEA